MASRVGQMTLKIVMMTASWIKAACIRKNEKIKQWNYAKQLTKYPENKKSRINDMVPSDKTFF